MENWYLPITLVPGIGLLLLSTTNLMVTLSNELSGLLKEDIKDSNILNRKLLQLKILNRVMTCFYISVAFLAIAGLVGASEIDSLTEGVMYIILVGIVFMLFALISLIKYSYRAVDIRQDQFKSRVNKMK